MTLSLLAALVAAWTSLQVSAGPDEAGEILAKAAEAYRTATSLQADFVQTITIAALEKEKQGRGVVYQKKPNYFLMKFEEPKGDVVVADGDYFWLYYPSAQPDQVIRTAIERTTEGHTLGGRFLVNPSERYVATYVSRETVDGRPAHLISLVLKFEAPYTLVRVWVDAGDYLVRRFEIFEQNQTVRSLTLQNLRANVDLPDKLFQFSPPPGVEVFKH